MMTGEASLTYTWTITRKPSGAGDPAFSVNGTIDANETTATFNSAGNYVFLVTIRDAGGLTVTSSVSIDVNQSLSSISVSPASTSVQNTASEQFSAVARDQFGVVLANQPAFVWSVDTGGLGSVSSDGIYTAPETGIGSASVRATAGGVSGAATAAVIERVRWTGLGNGVVVVGCAELVNPAGSERLGHCIN